MSMQQSRKADQRGFTLIEAMVVVAMVAILLAVAAPSLVTFQRNSELRATASTFLSSIQSARAEAMKRGVSTYMIPAANNDWATGWIVFADVDWDQALDRSKDAVVLTLGPISSKTTVASGVVDASEFTDGPAKYIRFNAGGYPITNAGALGGGAIEFKVTGTTDARRRVVLNPVGRARLCDPVHDTSTDCKQ
jgi:type IV fimbrial biogenesis protein FimT